MAGRRGGSVRGVLSRGESLEPICGIRFGLLRRRIWRRALENPPSIVSKRRLFWAPLGEGSTPGRRSDTEATVERPVVGDGLAAVSYLILVDKRMYTRLTRIELFDGANGGWLVRRFQLISSTSIR